MKVVVDESCLVGDDIGLASTVEIGSNPGATPRWDENEASTPTSEQDKHLD